MEAFTNLKESNFQLKTAVESLKAKLDDLNINIYKTQKKIQLIDEIQQKIKQMQEFSRISEDRMTTKTTRIEGEMILLKENQARVVERADRWNKNFEDIEKEVK